MGGFNVFQSLFSQIDQLTSTFVSSISGNVITSAMPVITAGLTVAFIFYGLLVARGAVEDSVRDFIFKCFKIGVIVSIASAGGLYQSNIADAIQKTPDEFATAILPSNTATANTQGQQAANMIDTAAQGGFTKAGDIFHMASWTNPGAAIGFAVMAGLCLVATIAVTAIGGAFILLAKIALAILAGLGPLFILALLFKSTSRFFEAWCGQVLSYGLLVVLISAVFGVMMQMFTGYMDSMKVDESQNIFWNVGGCGILAVACVLIVIQIPSIAAALANGVGVGLWHELRIASGMPGKAAGVAKATGRGVASTYSGGKAAAGAVGNAAGAVGRAVGRFKGSNRAAA